MRTTQVYLCNVPLDPELTHTIYFETKDDQLNYFLLNAQHMFLELTYQRKDGFIRVPEKYDTILNSNYVVYKNPYYSDKYYYAFIKDIQDKGDGRTDIYIETDPLQTYMFDYTVGKCFVEREHVDDDTIGKHTIPEKLEMGYFVCNDTHKDENLQNYVYIVQVTEILTTGLEGYVPEDFDYSSIPGAFISSEKVSSTNIGGIPTACGVFIFETYERMGSFCSIYDTAGKNEAIISAYMIPKTMIAHDYTDNLYKGQDGPSYYNVLVSKPNQCDGYTPKNNKLLTYPYSYLILSNNSGNANILNFECFDNEESATFTVTGIAIPGGSIKCIPTSYKGVVANHEEGIMCGKFPLLSWSSDLYLNWLTQNSLNNTIGVASGIASIVTGIAAGGPIGGAIALGGVSNIAGVMSETYKHSFTPDSAKGNTNGGDILTASKNNTFFFYSMSIKKEYAEMIDNYFSMYGYKVAAVKVPNKNHRQNYWFTKTVGANIKGAIPQTELQKIRNAYNNGITFWRSTADFRNYSDNEII